MILPLKSIHGRIETSLEDLLRDKLLEETNLKIEEELRKKYSIEISSALYAQIRQLHPLKFAFKEILC